MRIACQHLAYLILQGKPVGSRNPALCYLLRARREDASSLRSMPRSGLSVAPEGRVAALHFLADLADDMAIWLAARLEKK